MATTAGTPVPAVELSGITKAFPGVIANDHIDLRAYPGEVLCLLGENGAGKSTLMSILSGLYQPDSGTIAIHGRPVHIGSPRDGRDLGIGMVYQHLSLVPTMTVLENLMLGASSGVVLDEPAARVRLAELAGTLDVTVDAAARVGDLSLGQQQHVEIIKALWKGSRVLILDEPTSMLTPQGIVELQKVLRSLVASGLAIIFITHKLHEAIETGDRVVILKQGRVAGRLSPEELQGASAQVLQRRIVGLMFAEEGGQLADVAELQEEVTSSAQRPTRPTEPVVLELSSVSAPAPAGQHGIDDVSLTLAAGEILGVAGVDGNGQRAFAEVIAGQRRASAGDVRMAGESVLGLSVADRGRRGLRYVTDDRLGEGTVGRYSVALNLVLKRIGDAPFWRHGALDRGAIDDNARALIGAFDIRTPSPSTPIGRLSGGNIQKALLARELSFDPRVVVFNKPTHGLDVRTIAAVRQRIRALAESGVGVIVISTDLDELLDLSHRVMVLDEGRCRGFVDNGPDALARVGRLMVGLGADEAAA
ncbi:MAG: ABC transporter ATP-binding protein [Chloroflexota bacterium]